MAARRSKTAPPDNADPQHRLAQREAENAALRQANAALTRQLGESHEQQTATAEVLQVISRSAFDLQVVLDTLIENAVRLSGADCGAINGLGGECFNLLASFGLSDEWKDYLGQTP